MSKYIIFPLLLIISLCVDVSANNNYKIVTENYPPFNYMDNGKLKGISTEIVNKILTKIGWNDTKIEVLPWSIAISLAKHDPSTIIFSLAKTNEREIFYKWVGPISKNYWNIYSLSKIGNKELKLDIQSIEDAKKFSIAAQKDGAFAHFLENEGFSHIQYTKTIPDEIDKLLNYQTQLIAVAELPMYVILSQKGFDSETVKRVLKVKTNELYIGFNRNIPDSVVEKFSNALAEIKQNGDYDKITNKYYKIFLGKE
jgi:polar amino acid transport system substrate-binding protein